MREETKSAIAGFGAFVALAIAITACSGSGHSNSSLTSTNLSASPSVVPTPPGSPITNNGPPQTSPNPVPIPSPTPTPSPSSGPTNGSKFLYVANNATNNISTFALDPNTGVPSMGGNTALPASFTPTWLNVDPTNTLIFCCGTGGGGATGVVMGIPIASGVLTVGASVPTVGSFTFGLAIDPKNNFVYTADAGSGSVAHPAPGKISIFSYAATGALTALTPASVSDGTKGGPFAVAIDSTGGFLFSADNVDLGATGYTITPGAPGTGTDGQLTASLLVATPGTNPGPNVVIVNPSPNVLTVYAGNSDGSITVFGYNNLGALIAPATNIPATTNAHASVFGLAIDPAGKFLFSANTGSGDVSAFTINAVTGALTANGTPIVTTGSVPFAVALNQSGQVLYACDNGLNQVLIFNVAANGSITAAGTPTVALPAGATAPVMLDVSH